MHQLETLIQAIPPAVFAAGGSNALGNGVPHSPLDPSSSAHALFASSTHIFPTSIPPPSLNAFPLMNPSTFFAPVKPASRNSSPNSGGGFVPGQAGASASAAGMSAAAVDQLAEETSRMALSSSYLYFDDEGYTRWQGETSGLPLLDLLVERHFMNNNPKPDPDPAPSQTWAGRNGRVVHDWFPDRTPRRAETNPEVIWKIITSFIAPELMDRCDNRSFFLHPRT